MAPQFDQPDQEPTTTHQSKLPLSITPALLPLPLQSSGDVAAETVMGAIELYSMLLIEFIATVFTDLLATFVFFPPPAEIGGLDVLWQNSMFLFFGIWSLLTLSFLGARQIFPYSPKFNLYDYTVKSATAFLLLIIGRPMLNLVFEATNALGMYIWPASYPLNFAGQGIEMLLASAGGLVLGYYFGALVLLQSAIIVVLMLFAMLSIRAILLYTVYGFFPLFLAMWMVDLGPFKHSKNLAELAFKAFAVLLGLGIFTAAILATGAAIAGFESGESYENPTMEGLDNSATSSNCEESSSSLYSDVPEHCMANNSSTSGFIFKLIGFFGGILGTIAILGSGMSLLISMAGAGGGGGGRPTGRGEGTLKGGSRGGGAGGASGGGGGSAAGAGGAGGASGASGGSGGSSGFVAGAAGQALSAGVAGAQSLHSAGKNMDSSLGNVSLRDGLGTAGGAAKSAKGEFNEDAGFQTAAQFSVMKNQSPPALEGSKSAYPRDPPHDEYTSAPDRTSLDLQEAKSNPAKFDGEEYSLETSKFETYENPAKKSSEYGHKTGKFVTKSGTEVPYAPASEEAPELEEGEHYRVRGLQARAAQGHDGKYLESRGTEYTRAKHVEDGWETSEQDAGEVEPLAEDTADNRPAPPWAPEEGLQTDTDSVTKEELNPEDAHKPTESQKEELENRSSMPQEIPPQDRFTTDSDYYQLSESDPEVTNPDVDPEQPIATEDDRVDKLYESNDTSKWVASHHTTPVVNEEAAEAVAAGIHQELENPPASHVRNEVRKRVEQDLGDVIEAQSAMKAVTQKYSENYAGDDWGDASSKKDYYTWDSDT